MVKVNQYFDGKVKSLVLENKSGKFTAGVMEAGEYDFNTDSEEIMTVMAGLMKVQIKGETAWNTYRAFESFTIPSNSSFKIVMEEPGAYLCQYF